MPDAHMIQNKIRDYLTSHIEWRPDPRLTRLYFYLLVPIAAILFSPIWTPPPEVQSGITVAALLFAFHEYVEKRVLVAFEMIPQISGQVEKFADSYTFTGIIVVMDLMVAVPMYGFGDSSAVYTETAVTLIILVPYLWLMGQFCEYMADSMLKDAQGISRIELIGLVVFTAGMPIILFVGTKILSWIGRWGAIIGLIALPFEILLLDTFEVPTLLQYWALVTIIVVIVLVFSPRLAQMASSTHQS